MNRGSAIRPRRGQEKGGVEGLVGFARRNFLVPVPEVADFEDLNAQLLERCATDEQRRIGGRSDTRTIGERHAAESERLLALPETPFENTKVVGVRISRYQTAQVDSFESARPIRQWRPQWPAHYETVLERLRDRHGYSRGTREFISILQLHQNWDLGRVSAAIQDALDAHCAELEAVRHILMREDAPARSHAPLESVRMPGITDRAIAGVDLNRYDLLAGGVR